MTGRVKCDHCGWSGTEAEQLPHPRLGYSVCPTCWADGFETCPQVEWSGLMGAVLVPEPQPRVPKALIDWTDEECETWHRTQRAREAHERSEVRLKTSIDGKAQLGFDWMREEFRVAPINKPKPGRKGRK